MAEQPPQFIGYAILKGVPVAITNEFQPDVEWKARKQINEASAIETGCFERVGRSARDMQKRGDLFLEISKEYGAVGNIKMQKAFEALAASERLKRAGLLIAANEDEKYPLQRIEHVDEFQVRDTSLFAVNGRPVMVVPGLTPSALE